MSVPILTKLNNYGEEGPIRGVEVAQLLGDYGQLSNFLPTTNSVALYEPLSQGRRPLTHIQLKSFVEEFQLNQFGIPVGGRVAILLPNDAESAVCLISVISKYCAAPINPTNTWQEIKTELESTKSCAMIILAGAQTNDAALQAAKAIGITVIDITPDPSTTGLFRMSKFHSGSSMIANNTYQATRSDIIMLLHTSGTSGNKQLVPYSLEMIVVGVACIISSWNLKPSDICLNMMSLFHIGGIVHNILSPIFSGGSVITCSGFDPVLFWDILYSDHQNFTWYYASPTMHHAILQEAETRPKPLPVASIRYLANAGVLASALAESLRETFNVTILTSYECMPISSLLSDPAGTSDTSVGPDVLIVDDNMCPVSTGEQGNIMVCGAPCFSGYENSANNKSFFTINNQKWFNTGDIGYFDKDSCLFIFGRSKETSTFSARTTMQLIDGETQSQREPTPLLKLMSTTNKAGTDIGPIVYQDSISFTGATIMNSTGSFKSQTLPRMSTQLSSTTSNLDRGTSLLGVGTTKYTFQFPGNPGYVSQTNPQSDESSDIDVFEENQPSYKRRRTNVGDVKLYQAKLPAPSTAATEVSQRCDVLISSDDYNALLREIELLKTNNSNLISTNAALVNSMTAQIKSLEKCVLKLKKSKCLSNFHKVSFVKLLQYPEQFELSIPPANDNLEAYIRCSRAGRTSSNYSDSRSFQSSELGDSDNDDDDESDDDDDLQAEDIQSQNVQYTAPTHQPINISKFKWSMIPEDMQSLMQVHNINLSTPLIEKAILQTIFHNDVQAFHNYLAVKMKELQCIREVMYAVHARKISYNETKIYQPVVKEYLKSLFNGLPNLSVSVCDANSYQLSASIGSLTLNGHTDIMILEKTVPSRQVSADNCVGFIEIKNPFSKGLYQTDAFGAKDQLLGESYSLSLMQGNKEKLSIGYLTDLFALTLIVHDCNSNDFNVSARLYSPRDYILALLMMFISDRHTVSKCLFKDTQVLAGVKVSSQQSFPAPPPQSKLQSSININSDSSSNLKFGNTSDKENIANHSDGVKYLELTANNLRYYQ